MKKIISLLLIVLAIGSLTACGNKKSSGSEIPDVFGINYTNAIDILEAEGYEVNAIETSVGSISEKLLYPLEKVEKGNVFKIDDYILDNLGNLNKDYDVSYDGELVSEDKSVVIYYAKENYVLEKDNEASDDANTPSTDSTDKKTNSDTIEKKPKKQKSDDSAIDSDFKAAMKSYENFMNEYVEFMKKYSANPTDMSLLADYTDYMSKYADFVEDFEKWADEDMNAAETAYYIEVQERVNKKLLEVAE